MENMQTVRPQQSAELSPTIGFIDLGSNSIRLMVVRINSNCSYTILNQHKQMVRLGEGAFTTKHLAEASMSRTIDAMRNMAEICRGYGVSEVKAVATAAVRDAVNGAAFVDCAEAESGIRLEVIPGLEEARLIHLGVSTGLPDSDRVRLFIDIGGGSTELIAGRGTAFLHLDSLKLGAVRISNEFPELSAPGPVPQETYDKIRAFVRNRSLRSIQKIRKWHIDTMIGSSGTILNLAEIAGRNRKDSREERAEQNAGTKRLPLKWLAETAKKLRSLPLSERAKVPGINPQRVDIIVGGAAILQTLMEELHIDTLVTSNRGLLDGMLQDYLMHGAHGYLHESETASTRERSAIQLGRSCNFAEEHARWIARLSLRLFDSAREIGLHRYGSEERALLYYAALLHDIGLFLSFHNHHAHSRYIIRNADLLGFTRREIEIMATAVYFHRKSSVKRSGSGYEDMSGDDRKLAQILGLFLRMAESLDRSQQQTVADARLERKHKQIVLTLTLVQASPMELYAIDEVKGAFKKIFGKSFSVVPVLSP